MIFLFCIFYYFYSSASLLSLQPILTILTPILSDDILILRCYYPYSILTLFLLPLFYPYDSYLVLNDDILILHPYHLLLATILTILILFLVIIFLWSA
ncbi:uncharacterized protein BDV14DRAFT_177647 [Aspergillus stella-maris]|uniref:uncharacterized protein n=1 Tax=Aspergillus stella-maris TaxID=1810926 RepID=UPI003CCDBBA9